MGQREEYLADDANWHASFDRDERLDRWWAGASFGLALSGKASRAVYAADRALAIAETARELVHHQAVYALHQEGESVREIADHLQLSKSKVGRIVKHITRNGELVNYGILPPHGAHEETRNLVYDAWNMTELDGVTRDHRRGTFEPQSVAPESPNVNGTNRPHPKLDGGKTT